MHKQECSYYNLPGYISYFSCRNSNINKKSGGGITILVSDKIKVNLVKEISNNYDNLLLLNLITKNINIGVVYSPPDAPKDPLIDAIDELLTSTPTIILGDFNMDLLEINPTVWTPFYLLITFS